MAEEEEEPSFGKGCRKGGARHFSKPYVDYSVRAKLGFGKGHVGMFLQQKAFPTCELAKFLMVKQVWPGL